MSDLIDIEKKIDSLAEKLDQDISKKKKTMTITVIGGIVLLIIVFIYFGFIKGLINEVLEPQSIMMVAGDKIVHGDEIDTGGGDFNSVNIGAGAQVGQVAAGRNITQASGGANEKNDLRQKLADLTVAVEAMRNQVDARSFKLGTYQLKDVEAELRRTEGTPSGANLIEAAHGLVESFPAIGGPLGAVLKTAAAQKALAAAGVSDLATKFG